MGAGRQPRTSSTLLLGDLSMVTDEWGREEGERGGKLRKCDTGSGTIVGCNSFQGLTTIKRQVNNAKQQSEQ